jgi:hypothetical protein
MLQIIHCCVLLYIVFVIAEIRNVLVYSDPSLAAPITIWEEVQHPPDSSSYKVPHKL